MQISTPCQLWQVQGRVHHSGYGVLDRDKKILLAHRVAYMEYHGVKLTPQQKVCHHCDVKACVNPEHLFVGSQKDNIDDMDRKGRRVKVPGERNGRAKLTEQDVRAIREDTRTIKEVANAFGIGKSQVSNIKSRYSWSHI